MTPPVDTDLGATRDDYKRKTQHVKLISVQPPARHDKNSSAVSNEAWSVVTWQQYHSTYSWKQWAAEISHCRCTKVAPHTWLIPGRDKLANHGQAWSREVLPPKMRVTISPRSVLSERRPHMLGLQTIRMILFERQLDALLGRIKKRPFLHHWFPWMTDIPTLRSETLLQGRSEQARRHGRGFGGLSPPIQSSKPPKLKYEILYISGIFVKFECQAPPPART